MNEIRSNDFGKYDDPTTISNNIRFLINLVTEVKNLGFEGEVSPYKLKSVENLTKGFGEDVIQVLVFLTNRAMKVKKVSLKPPRLDSVSRNTEEPELDDEGDSNLDMGDAIQEVEEEDFGNQDFAANVNEEKAIIESKVDEKKWLLECERVATKLKFNIKSEGKEWRVHCDQVKQFCENMKKQSPEGRMRLEKMSDDLSRILEKISKREKSINVNLNEIVFFLNKGEEYRKRSEDMKTMESRYKNLNSSVRDLSEKYRTISEKLETIQSKTSDHGNAFTDSSPIVKIKGALQKLKTDIKNMELRIGVLNHSVIQHKIKEHIGDESWRF